MLVPDLLLANPFLARLFFDAIPKRNDPLLVIDGYPEFATSVNDLEPDDRQKVKDLAKKIVDSHKTSTPIVAFVVRGHADVALTVSAEKRAQFEQEKSEQRADGVRNLLLQEIIKIEPTGKLVASTVGFDSKGLGSRFRKRVPTPGHPLTESDMKKNRRIELFTAERFVPLPEPVPKLDPAPPRPVVGTHWRILIKSGSVTTILTPTDLTSVTVLLTLEITDLDRKQKATFGSKTTGTGLPGGSSSPSVVQTTQVTEGTPTDFTTTKGVGLGDFAGSVSVFQNPGAGVSVLSAGGNFNFSFEEMENTQATFTRPKVVPASAGSGVFTLPNVGLGLVSTGSLTMKGKPVAAP